MQIKLICEHCRRPVSGSTGAVSLYDDELAEAQHAALAHAAAQEAAVKILEPLGTALSADDLMRAPSPARWRTEHTRCATGGPGYEIATERLTTVLDALDWTVHLMGKDWIRHTDWDRFITRTVLRPARATA